MNSAIDCNIKTGMYLAWAPSSIQRQEEVTYCNSVLPLRLGRRSELEYGKVGGFLH